MCAGAWMSLQECCAQLQHRCMCFVPMPGQGQYLTDRPNRQYISAKHVHTARQRMRSSAKHLHVLFGARATHHSHNPQPPGPALPSLGSSACPPSLHTQAHTQCVRACVCITPAGTLWSCSCSCIRVYAHSAQRPVLRTHACTPSHTHAHTHTGARTLTHTHTHLPCTCSAQRPVPDAATAAEEAARQQQGALRAQVAELEEQLEQQRQQHAAVLEGVQGRQRACHGAIDAGVWGGACMNAWLCAGICERM